MHFASARCGAARDLAVQGQGERHRLPDDQGIAKLRWRRDEGRLFARWAEGSRSRPSSTQCPRDFRTSSRSTTTSSPSSRWPSSGSRATSSGADKTIKPADSSPQRRYGSLFASLTSSARPGQRDGVAPIIERPSPSWRSSREEAPSPTPAPGRPDRGPAVTSAQKKGPWYWTDVSITA